MGLLEGKEVDKQIGNLGGYSADLTDKGMLKIEVHVEIDLVAEAQKLAEKTQTPIDNQAIAWLKLLMGRT